MVVRAPRTHGFELSFRTTTGNTVWNHKTLFAKPSFRTKKQWSVTQKKPFQSRTQPFKIPLEKILHTGMFYWHFQKQAKGVEARCFRVSFGNAPFCKPFWGRNLPVFEPEKDFYGKFALLFRVSRSFSLEKWSEANFLFWHTQDFSD